MFFCFVSPTICTNFDLKSPTQWSLSISAKDFLLSLETLFVNLKTLYSWVLSCLTCCVWTRGTTSWEFWRTWITACIELLLCVSQMPCLQVVMIFTLMHEARMPHVPSRVWPKSVHNTHLSVHLPFSIYYCCLLDWHLNFFREGMKFVPFFFTVFISILAL